MRVAEKKHKMWGHVIFYKGFNHKSNAWKSLTKIVSPGKLVLMQWGGGNN